MGVRLKTKRGQSLYDFWGDRVSAALNEAGQGHRDRVLVNCASQEYFGAVDVAALKTPVVSVPLRREKDGEAKVISFYAKRARGLMARFALTTASTRRADLRAFDVAGYRFDRAASSDAEFVFTRPQPAPLTARASRARP
jgi:cytoplasmic iron level regulating protein YaaA (DUF328/UPF0246 family)